MRHWKRPPRMLLVALAACLLCFTPAQAKKPDKPGGGGGGGDAGPSYQIVELDSVGSLLEGHPIDINNSGLIVGTVNEPILDEWFAASWTVDKAGGTVTSTLHLLADGHHADGVNDHGEIVGFRVDEENEAIAVYWESWEDATPLDLEPLDGDTRSSAKAINNEGVICGYSARKIYGPDPENLGGDPIVVDTERRAVVWKVTEGVVEGPVELPGLDLDDSSIDTAINENDADGIAQVVG